MARSMRSLVAAPLLALALMTGVAVAGPTATASADTWNSGSAYLSFPSSPGFNAPCVGRRIYLARGTYRWRLYSVHRAHPNDPTWSPNRFLGLNSGWYRWEDCLKHERVWNGHRYEHIYAHVSRLYQLATGGAPAAKWWREWGRKYGSGTYDYGSALRRTGS